MFEALKKKLSSWLGKPEEKEEKKQKKTEKKAKKAKITKKEEREIKTKEKKAIIEKIKEEVEKRPEKKTEKKPEKKVEEPILEEAEEIVESVEEDEKNREKSEEDSKGKVTSQEIQVKEGDVSGNLGSIHEEKPKGFLGFFGFKKKKEVKKEPVEKKAEEIIENLEIEAEEIQEENKEAEVPKKEGFISKLFSKFQSAKITEENFNEIFQELEIILLENNVALEVVEKIKEALAKSLVGFEVKRTEIESRIMLALKEAILDVLIEPPNIIEQIKSKEGEPFVILFFGINGSGKTTSIAKLAHKLKKQNISTIMAAGDTFRAASIEQLQTHGQKLGIEVVSKEYGSDPSAVAFDAIQQAKKNNVQVVLIDTAGRMYTKSNLMKEMEKIVRVSKPDLKIFVGESITGNDATEQAKTFNETAGIDGIILSKADVDEKAGTILSVSYVTKKPIYYLGTGQGYDDLQEFKKSNVLEHIGLG